MEKISAPKHRPLLLALLVLWAVSRLLTLALNLSTIPLDAWNPGNYTQWPSKILLAALWDGLYALVQLAPATLLGLYLIRFYRTPKSGKVLPVIAYALTAALSAVPILNLQLSQVTASPVVIVFNALVIVTYAAAAVGVWQGMDNKLLVCTGPALALVICVYSAVTSGKVMGEVFSAGLLQLDANGIRMLAMTGGSILINLTKALAFLVFGLTHSIPEE